MIELFEAVQSRDLLALVQVYAEGVELMEPLPEAGPVSPPEALAGLHTCPFWLLPHYILDPGHNLILPSNICGYKNAPLLPLTRFYQLVYYSVFLFFLNGR